MSRNDRQARLELERGHIRAAAERLIGGRAQRSNGTLTASTLAMEAAISRQRLYEHHSDLVDDFKSRAGTGPVAPNLAALEHQLDQARKRIDEVESRERELLAENKALRAVIAELTHESRPSNIIVMPTNRAARHQSTIDGGQQDQ